MSNRRDYSSQDQDERDDEHARPKKVTFDDFQIQKRAAQAQVDEEKRAWQQRQERLEQQKPGFLRFAVPRLRSLKDDMIGGKKKLSSLFGRPSNSNTEDGEEQYDEPEAAEPYFAEHEKLVIRVSPKDRTDNSPHTYQEPAGQQEEYEEQYEQDDYEEEPYEEQEYQRNGYSEEQLKNERRLAERYAANQHDHEAQDHYDHHQEAELRYEEEEYEEVEASTASDHQNEELEAVREFTSASLEEEVEEGVLSHASAAETNTPAADLQPATIQSTVAQTTAHVASVPTNMLKEEPEIDSSLRVFLDSLRSFDSHPKRSHEPRDPRADFVTLLNEILAILREQVGALSAMFFWVNNKKQQLVLESASLDDAVQFYLSEERKFPIELDAISRVVTRGVPELVSSIPTQAELDLIPYYTDAIGIASFAAMPVLFGNSLVAVLTVDSNVEEIFSPETLRILSSHSKVISGLIKSYIEKYDLLSSARTLESARKLHQIVSPDTSLRSLRDQRKTPEWIQRALAEAASEIIDWEWLSTVSFDENRRTWSINALQSKHAGAYVPPQTVIALNESIVGRTLQTGRSSRMDSLTSQHVRFSLEEDRTHAVGHSFLAIPIRTTNKNYGVLAIEHAEKARFSEADVETLEHLARSAAAALEITALSDIVAERALTDLLTGVLNRRGFMLRLNEELSRAMEFDEPLTVALFELDGAADFLARFSQEDSDTIVLAITRLLKFGSRPFDVVARVGEHTFAALLIRMPDEEGYLWSEKMRKMIVSEVIAIGRRSFSVTVSVGVAGARRDATVEELVEGAEMAIERAKELGGNNVIVY